MVTSSKPWLLLEGLIGKSLNVFERNFGRFCGEFVDEFSDVFDNSGPESSELSTENCLVLFVGESFSSASGLSIDISLQRIDTTNECPFKTPKPGKAYPHFLPPDKVNMMEFIRYCYLDLVMLIFCSISVSSFTPSDLPACPEREGLTMPSRIRMMSGVKKFIDLN